MSTDTRDNILTAIPFDNDTIKAELKIRSTSLSYVKRKPSKDGNYIVQAGENLSTLAVKFNTTVAKLAEMNGIDAANLHNIYAGEKLWMPELNEQAFHSRVAQDPLNNWPNWDFSGNIDDTKKTTPFNFNIQSVSLPTEDRTPSSIKQTKEKIKAFEFNEKNKKEQEIRKKQLINIVRNFYIKQLSSISFSKTLTQKEKEECSSFLKGEMELKIRQISDEWNVPIILPMHLYMQNSKLINDFNTYRNTFGYKWEPTPTGEIRRTPTGYEKWLAERQQLDPFAYQMAQQPVIKAVAVGGLAATGAAIAPGLANQASIAVTRLSDATIRACLKGGQILYSSPQFQQFCFGVVEGYIEVNVLPDSPDASPILPLPPAAEAGRQTGYFIEYMGRLIKREAEKRNIQTEE